MNAARVVARASLVSALAIAVFGASPAHADDVEGCVKSAELGQSARRSDSLLSARGHLISCAREVCPALIRADCARWLDDVEARLPAASVRVTSDDGRDISAKVIIDGAGSSVPAGKSIRLDPGNHTFRAEAEGFETAEERAVLSQGERARVITLVMKAKVAQPLGPIGPPGLTRACIPSRLSASSRSAASRISVCEVAPRPRICAPAAASRRAARRTTSTPRRANISSRTSR